MMKIVYAEVTDTKTVVRRSAMVDKRLSPEARWLLVYLRGQPERGDFNINEVRRISGVGRDQAYRRVLECIEAGYLDRRPICDTSGRGAGLEYTPYDVPRPQADGRAA